MEFNKHSKGASFFEIFQGLNWRRTLAGCIGICSQWTAGAPIVFAYSTVSSNEVLPASLNLTGCVVLLQSCRYPRSFSGQYHPVSRYVLVSMRITCLTIADLSCSSIKFSPLSSFASSSVVDLFSSGKWRQIDTADLETDIYKSGCFLMFVFNVCLGTTGFFKSDSSSHAALAFLLLWVICYGFSAGPIWFVASGETSTPRLRAQTTSFNLGCYGLGL